MMNIKRSLHFKIASILLSLGFSGVLPAQDAGDAFQKYEPEVRAAVNRGLDYLISAEQGNGTFPEAHGQSTGISSLVGMAILSTGATPGNGRYGEAINRRIDYALGHIASDGVLSSGDHGNGPMYAHNITTLFLSECSGMVDLERQRKIDPALSRAIKILLDAQAVKKDPRNQGGWRYHPNSNDSDVSCSGWALMALRSARLNGAPVPVTAIESAVDYIHRMQSKKAGTVGYMNESEHKESLTGAGLLCMELCGRHAAPENIMAADWLLENYTKIQNSEFSLYGNYYAAQGMFQMGGKYWKTYSDYMYSHYLPLQKPDGCWEGERFGKVYSTSLMVLAMVVPFRQLPIYQRDERVDEEQ